MAQQIVDYLSKDCFNCAVCVDRFKNPKMLPCAHTFCSSCLEKVSSGLGSLACPTCRKNTNLPFGGVQDFPSSFLIASLMERIDMANQSKLSSSSCTSCQGMKEVHLCLDCKFNVCTTCKTFHDKIPGTSDHITVPIERLLEEEYMADVLASYIPRCDHHKEEKLVLFCSKCNQLVCRDCKIVDHPNHKVVTTDEGHSSMRRKLESLLELTVDQSQSIQKISKDVDSSMSRVQEHSISVRKEVNEYYKEFVDKCKTGRDTLLNDIGQKEQRHLEPLQKVSAEVRKWDEEMEHTMKLTRRILDESVKWKVLKDADTLTETLQKLSEDERRIESIGTDVHLGSFSFKRSARKPYFGNILGKICDEETDAPDNNWTLAKSDIKPALSETKKSGKGPNMFAALSSTDLSFLRSAKPDTKSAFSVKPKKSEGGFYWSGSSASSDMSFWKFATPDAKSASSVKPKKNGDGPNLSGPSSSTGQFYFTKPDVKSASSVKPKNSEDGPNSSGASSFADMSFWRSESKPFSFS